VRITEGQGLGRDGSRGEKRQGRSRADFNTLYLVRAVRQRRRSPVSSILAEEDEAKAPQGAGGGNLRVGCH
jgi:hypothetical protein